MSRKSELPRLRSTLSESRLKPYLAACSDEAAGLRAYERNIFLSARYLVAAHFCEIALRNELNDMLRHEMGENWLHQKGALLPAQQGQLAIAEKRLRQDGKQPLNDNLVSELPFGFWVGLLGRKYEYRQQYWRKVFHRGFVNRPRGMERAELYENFNAVRRYRNRIAHHERILHRKPEKSLNRCLRTIGWICSRTENWARGLIARMP